MNGRCRVAWWTLVKRSLQLLSGNLKKRPWTHSSWLMVCIEISYTYRWTKLYDWAKAQQRGAPRKIYNVNSTCDGVLGCGEIPRCCVFSFSPYGNKLGSITLSLHGMESQFHLVAREFCCRVFHTSRFASRSSNLSFQYFCRSVQIQQWVNNTFQKKDGMYRNPLA